MRCRTRRYPGYSEAYGVSFNRGHDFVVVFVFFFSPQLSTKIKQLSVAPMLAETINRLHWCGLACLRAGAQAPRTLPF